MARNSQAPPAAGDDPAGQAVVTACGAAALLAARAPVRIDCRQQADGADRLIDLNPNMTGPGRDGRGDQLSMSGIAAAALGLSYADLLLIMLAGAWT